MRESSRFGAILAIILNTFGHSYSSDNGNSNSTSTIGESTTASSIGSVASTVVSGLGNGTCASRTANYITHTLPQQCLRADRTAGSATKTAGSDAALELNGTTMASDAASLLATVSHSLDESTSTSNVDDPLTEASVATESGEILTTSVSSIDTASSENMPAFSTQTEAEPDSPLDNANFLSFEEWKKQNSAKAEPASDPNGALDAADRQRTGLSNALDSLGEEGEIDMDFSGFGGRANAPRQQQAAYRSADPADSTQSAPSTTASRSKDAGKTCKERTNYASFDCAATMLKTNPECSSAASVLVENKDSYMLNTCSADNKFLIVELCNDILVDTVVLANYEFFSSIFRHFRVSVSDRYPVKMDKWKELGTFEARNTREVQAFLIEHPQIWARYLRIEFLTHYGGEYYCPVSLLRVHGTTMLEEIRPQEEVAPGDNLDEQAALEPETIATPMLAPGLTTTRDELEENTQQPAASVDVESIPPDASNHSESAAGSEPILINDTAKASVIVATNITGLIASVELPRVDEMTCASNMTSAPTESTLTPAILPEGTESSPSNSHITVSPTTSTDDATVSDSDGFDTATSTQLPSSNVVSNETTVSEELSGSMNATGTIIETSTLVSAVSTSNSTAADTPSTHVADSTVVSPTNSTRIASSTASAPPQPQPSTQESFFKSIHKRLQQLESNSTLSLQYIEEQSRILRDAFSKVEKRQISSTTTFLTNLNATVMTELQGFRQAYDQLWQSTVIELEGQREQYQREMLAMSSRLTLVAEELVWQKRVGVLQSTLLIICLGLVLFARPSSSGSEIPLMQQMMNKSQAALGRAGWESPELASPSPEGRSPVRALRRRLWRSITDPLGSGEVTDATDSRPQTREGPEEAVDVRVEPPTPASMTPASLTVASPGKASGCDGHDGEYDDGDEMLDIREARSGPSTPRGTRERLDKPPDGVSVDVDPFEL